MFLGGLIGTTGWGILLLVQLLPDSFSAYSLLSLPFILLGAILLTLGSYHAGKDRCE